MHANVRFITFCMGLSLAALPLGCGELGKTSDKNSESGQTDPNSKTSTGSGPTTKLSLTTSGLLSKTDAVTLTRSAFSAALLTTPPKPEDEDYGYPGIGVNYGDVIIDGLKINLRSINISGRSGVSGSANPTELVTFEGAGKELQVAEGFSGKIEVAKDISLPNGSYNEVNLSFQNTFSVKAYAYLDGNNDGTIDTTIWTTPTEIKMVSSKVTPDNLTGYDYYKYPWAVATLAKNATDNSAESYNVSSVFRTPVIVKDGKITTSTNGVTSTESDALALDILIDTYNYVKVWDGRFGTGSVENFVQGVPNINTTTGMHQLPPSVFPFPQGLNDSRTGGGGVSMNTLYPENKPAFALSNYLSAFALVNSSGIKAQIYLIGKDAIFTPFNNQSFTLVLDGNGEPQFAKVGIGELSTTLHVGAFARIFEKKDDASYTFATSGGGTDSSGNDDGGLAYKDEVTRAGHLFSGFRKLAIGQKSTLQMKDGPRCKSQYDYCVGSAGVTAHIRRVR